MRLFESRTKNNSQFPQTFSFVYYFQKGVVFLFGCRPEFASIFFFFFFRFTNRHLDTSPRSVKVNAATQWHTHDVSDYLWGKKGGQSAVYSGTLKGDCGCAFWSYRLPSNRNWIAWLLFAARWRPHSSVSRRNRSFWTIHRLRLFPFFTLKKRRKKVLFGFFF